MGAGAAGISAANYLHAHNLTDFYIVDAQSFIGGRVQHASFGHSHVELGANWIYGKVNNPIYKLAMDHGLKTAANDKSNAIFFNEHGPVKTSEGRQVYNTFGNVMSKLADYADQRMERDQVDISGRSGLRMVNWHPKTAMESAVEYFWIDWELGEPAEVDSLDYATASVTAFEGAYPGGNEFVVDPRGFNHIIQSEAANFLQPSDPRLLLNTTIKDIYYSDDNVTVVTENGDRIVADYALCTFSIGVLQGEDIRFIPSLPDWKRESLYMFHLATYTKIFLRFPFRFWPREWQFALYASNSTTTTNKGGYYTVWQNLNAPGYLDSDAILMVTTIDKESERIERMTEDQVLEEIMIVLRQMFGPDIPQAIDILIPHWRSNPLFRGSYSNWPLGVVPQQHHNLRAPLQASPGGVPRLWFAGEATSRDAYGSLHGAWLEGEAAGKSIANCVQSACPHYPYSDYVTGCDQSTSVRFLRQYRAK